MTYNEFIQNIIKTRGQWNVNGYYEKHHIIPKCLGGKGDYTNGRFKLKSHHINCIWLTITEHFIAHKLLAQENPNNKKIVKAFWSMCTIDKKVNLNLSVEDYEKYRIQYIQTNSGKNNPMSGKTHTIEARLKISKTNLGVKRSAEFKENRRLYMLGRKWYNNGNISVLFKENEVPAEFIPGRLPFRHKKHSDETKEKLRQINLGKKHSNETKEKCKLASSNRVYYHDKSGNEILLKIGETVPEGYIIGISENHKKNIKKSHQNIPGRVQTEAEKLKRSQTLKQKYEMGIYSHTGKNNGMFGKKQTDNTKEKIRLKAKNKCFVYKEGVGTIRINLDELDEYIANGWKRGRKAVRL